MNRKLAGTLLAVALMMAPMMAFAQQQPAAQPGSQQPQQPPAQAPAQQPSAAQPQRPSGPPPTRIGIINIQQAILNTNEGRRDFETLEKKFEPKRSELQKLQTELEDLRKQLTTQGDKLNDEARTKLARDIEQRERRLRSSFEEAQSDFQTEQGEIANRVGGKLVEVINDYAQANGFVVILDVSNPQSGVLWAAAASDVTPSVVEAYNARHAADAPPAAPSSSQQQRPAQGTGTQRPQGANTQRPQTSGTPR